LDGKTYAQALAALERGERAERNEGERRYYVMSEIGRSVVTALLGAASGDP